MYVVIQSRCCYNVLSGILPFACTFTLRLNICGRLLSGMSIRPYRIKSAQQGSKRKLILVASMNGASLATIPVIPFISDWTYEQNHHAKNCSASLEHSTIFYYGESAAEAPGKLFNMHWFCVIKRRLLFDTISHGKRERMEKEERKNSFKD